MLPKTQKHHFAKIATLFFILTYFFIKINHNNDVLFYTHFENVEVIILSAILLFFLPVAYKSAIDGQKVVIILLVVTLICLIEVPYWIIYHYSPLVGTFEEYVIRFFRLTFYIMLIMGYSLFLFDEEYLIKVFWNISIWIMVISIISYVAYKAFGINYLLHFYGDTPRIEGFFTEPSTFAPMLSVIIILSLRRKKYISLVLAIICIILTKSPVVILTLGLSFPLVFLLKKRGNGKKILTLLFICSLVILIQQIFKDSIIQSLLNSSSDTAYSFGRLMYGFQNILTNGDIGKNDRFEGAVEVYNTLKDNGLLWFGYGLNSSSTYFLDKFGSPRDYSLFLTMFFSYGIMGLTLFSIICIRTVLYVRKIESEFLYVLVPFLVASSINSAEGFVSYGFVFVGIFAYWLPKHFKSKIVANKIATA